MTESNLESYYTLGPTSGTATIQHKFRKRRKSKLDPHEGMIKTYIAKGMSLQFICDRLAKQNVFCNRSSVSRFYKNLLKL